ncbi:hypothetical protein Pmani_036588 [Petrolisthes manimaculis]|uniref:Chitin-binding type-2 domain-containing protein n=1 Tax=Petrolisthes manimaculis TaxID=1843537 RepID=A0AAE1NJV5_9EUCA|nr:hypothetical protein Pmani_036588 [Petrolisthes manimaculis]
MWTTLLLVVAGVAMVTGIPQGLSKQDNSPTLSNFKCKEDGIFPDREQCDMYWKCEFGQASRHYCDDGLVFDPIKGLRGRVDPCDSPLVIDCSDRPFLQEPTHPTPECIRRHGTFEDPDPAVCNKYHVCKEGYLESTLACTGTLQFNPITGNCEWPYSARRVGCADDTRNCIENGKFCCTGEKRYTIDGQEDPHPTYPDGNDCEMFYICLNQLIPKRSSCEKGLVFNTATGICDIPENVPECIDPGFA